MGMNSYNSRILIIDDEESVQTNIGLILCPPGNRNEALDRAAEIFFGDSPAEKTAEGAPQFQLSFASNGMRALKEVERAIESDQPFAGVFCDMRMPGWDGLKTIEEIRRVDPRVEVVFLTAYSDHSIEQISEAVGVNIAYMTKPFSRSEIRQMAVRCVIDWNKSREFENFVEILSKIRGSAGDAQDLLGHIVKQLCILLNTDSVALGEFRDGRLSYRTGVGMLARQEIFDSISGKITKGASRMELIEVDGVWAIPIFSFGYALANAADRVVSPEKQHLVNVFLEYSSIALQNSRLNSELAQKEKMSELGRVMSFICHDIRGPLGMVEQYLHLLRVPSESPWSPEILHKKIVQYLDKVRDLANDILLFADNNIRINKSPVSTQLLLNTDAEYWQQLAEYRKVRLLVETTQPTEILVDGPRLIRAVTNLVKNAIEACRDKQTREVTVSVVTSDNVFECRVRDTAGGISEKIRPNLFQPFASAGKSHGTGLGLAIVQEVVSLHNGTIEVKSDAAGSEFIIPIPLEDQFKSAVCS
jgi:signal transduction histidine kinase